MSVEFRVLRTADELAVLPEFEDRMRLFHPHVVELTNKLPTAVTIMFSP